MKQLSEATLRMGFVLSTALLVTLFVAGCASSPDEPQQQQKQERPDVDFSEPPEDYLDVDVLGIVAAPMQGPAVLLGKGGDIEEDEMPDSVLPIFISPSQAMAIQLGLEEDDFDRPLTHDLLGEMLAELDGEIAKVHVDDLRAGTFIATIFLVTPTEVVEIDARPSDAIALISGSDVPVYVAEHVMEEAGLTDEDVEQMPPADPGEPEDFDDQPTTPL